MAHIKKRTYKTKTGEARVRFYVIATGDDGKRVFHSRHQYAKDAKAELHRVQVMEDSGTYSKPSANVTFTELAEEYLRDYVAVRCKQRTYDDYANSLNVHAVPYFGTYKLKDITRKKVEEYVADLQGKGLGTRSVNKNLTQLKQVLNKGVEWEHIDRSPARDVKPIKAERKEVDFLEIDEIQRFLEAARTEPDHYAMFCTAVLAGLRMGELAGLQRGDIDLVKGVIYVRRQYHPRYGYTTPKSWAGVRSVPLCEHLRGILDDHLDSTDGDLEDILFPNKFGLPMDGNNLSKDLTRSNRGREVGAFKRVLERAGLRLVHFHSLRHSYAALLVHAGVTPKALQAVMGHSTISVTLDVYGHLYGDYLDGVVEKMDALVFSPQVLHFPKKQVVEA